MTSTHCNPTAFSGKGILLGILIGVSACGGSSGGRGGVEDADMLGAPIIDVEGSPGKFSMTPAEANAAVGPPPVLPQNAKARNHYFRLEFPFRVSDGSIFGKKPQFSFLNGNITVTDRKGKHVAGLAILNGMDANGKDRTKDDGFPKDRVDGGPDRNKPFTDDDGVKKDVFVFIADHDDDLSTTAAFNLGSQPESGTSALDQIKITVNQIEGIRINGAWTINIGGGQKGDTRAPQIVSVIAESPDPADPNNPGSADVRTSFLVEFDEAMVPQAVGRSALLNGPPFNGNMPLVPFTTLPSTVLVSNAAANVPPIYLPFDCNPVNDNNLLVYRLRPLINLPSNSLVRLTDHAITVNTNAAATDLSGTAYDGPDLNNDGVPDGTNLETDFLTGEGPAVVNVPVSPEVVYWIPNQGKGIGAIDLNGKGYNTNTPGANADEPSRASIITRSATYNIVSGIALLGHPCDVNICIHNNYTYPVGTGGYLYGAGITPGWEDPNDPGNPGTPVPGINEGSSGFETLCRDSTGNVILTGTRNTDVGVLEDVIVGDVLDRVFFDTGNFWADESNHVSFFGGVFNGRNSLSDPPSPNPPPNRFWVGLGAIDTVVDQSGAEPEAFVIEGEEVFTGIQAGMTGWDWVQPNELNPFGPDQTIFPHFSVGPGVQSATQSYLFSARQQIGNFLYVTDVENRMLHVLNSNTMRVLDSLSLPDPTGLAVAPDNRYVYVSNFSNDSVSVVGSDPTQSDFHQEVARVQVGRGPRQLAVQPDNEDIFVLNFLEDTVSIMNQQDFSIRKTIDALVDGPFDIHLTGRQGAPASPWPYGFQAGIYFGYLSNLESNSIVVFESGPDGPQGIGHDNILGELPTGDDDPPIVEPRGICASPYLNPQGLLAGGCFVAHRGDDGTGRVTHIQFTNQIIFGPLPIQAPPGFFIPPGFLDRNFDVVGQWGTSEANRLAGSFPTDVTLADVNVDTYQGNPTGPPNNSILGVPPNVAETGLFDSHHTVRHAGLSVFATWVPDRLYIAYGDMNVIQVVDPLTAGVVLNTIEGTGAGVKKLGAYWHQ